MPSRIIKESICTSEDLAAISPEAEVLFYRLIVKADDFGLYHGNPQIIASMCFPLAPPKEQRVKAWISELCKAGLVGTYTGDDGKKYISLLSWSKHQQQRAAKSKFPLPTSLDNSCNQSLESDNSDSCNQMIADSLVNENVNDNENEKRKRGTHQKKANDVPDGFDSFWSVYPKRVGKVDAIKAWGQIQPDEETIAAIVAGVERWKRSDQWTKDEGRFIPYPATFLRGERWNEEDRADVAPVPKAAPAKKSYDDDEDFLKG